MLSANEVKIHGMSDSRWTIKDKMSQYKSLIGLYTRDKKLLQSEFNIQKKQKMRTIKQLTREIEMSRDALENAITGDRQALRNALQEHKNLQLAYQHLPPEKVVENIHQTNFKQRKELDRLKYRMKATCKKLTERKLNLAYLEDCELFSQSGKLPWELQAEVITGKVQNAILKQEAAITVRYTYKKLLELLKKDTYYYDALLTTLLLDLRNQANCLQRTTELGQLATEFLDDRRYDLIATEADTKDKRNKMLNSIEEIKVQVEMVTSNIRTLIRKDSDINIPKKNRIVKTEDDERLLIEVYESENILNNLQMIVMVPNYESVYPYLVIQKKTKENLQMCLKNLMREHEILTNKRNCAQIKLNNLCYTMIDTTLEYMDKKRMLSDTMESYQKETADIRKRILQNGDLVLNIRTTLKQILFTLKPILTKKELAKKNVSYEFLDDMDISNENIIMKTIRQKLNLAMNVFNKIKESSYNKNEASMLYSNLLEKYAYMYEVPSAVKEDALLEFSVPDSTIYTRKSLKEESSRIVLECNVDPDLIFKPPKKKR